MFSFNKADFSAVATVLLSGLSLTLGHVVEILAGIAAIVTAIFASYHYYNLAQLNKEKKIRLRNDPFNSDPDH